MISGQESPAVDDEIRLGPPSVAVLPFDDMSKARDQNYFCEGVAETGLFRFRE